MNDKKDHIEIYHIKSTTTNNDDNNDLQYSKYKYNHYKNSINEKTKNMKRKLNSYYNSYSISRINRDIEVDDLKSFDSSSNNNNNSNQQQQKEEEDDIEFDIYSISDLSSSNLESKSNLSDSI